MSKSKDTEIKLFGTTITSLLAVDHHDPSSLSSIHGVSNQSKEAYSSSSSSCSPSTGPNMVCCHANLKVLFVQTPLFFIFFSNSSVL